jgi:hypothetical protein
VISTVDELGRECAQGNHRCDEGEAAGDPYSPMR